MDDTCERRIRFDPETETMEADFSDLVFETPNAVGTFYDTVERLIAETGREKWFFLVNYRNCRIMPSAWLAHSQRGKRLNATHSLGTVRFDASPETSDEIRRRAGTEAFDANLFDNRDDAVARIAELRAERPAWMARKPKQTQYSPDEFRRRIGFLVADGVMDVDFSDFDFDTNADVNAFYDHIEARIAETGRQKWYFLVNYRNCQISLQAWISFSQRGKRLNIAHSLGSVRYGTDLETEKEIRSQADRMDFRPNIRVTREQALERIAEMKSEAQEPV